MINNKILILDYFGLSETQGQLNRIDSVLFHVV